MKPLILILSVLASGASAPMPPAIAGRNQRHERPEWKSFPEDEVGLLERRRLVIAAHIPIGKESDEIKDEENEESEGEFNDETRADPGA